MLAIVMSYAWLCSYFSDINTTVNQYLVPNVGLNSFFAGEAVNNVRAMISTAYFFATDAQKLWDLQLFAFLFFIFGFRVRRWNYGEWSHEKFNLQST